MGNNWLAKFRNCGDHFEHQADRKFISFREWFSYNPFSDSFYHRDQHIGQYLCTLVMLRILFAITAGTMIIMSVLGLMAAAFGHNCHNDTNACEHKYLLHISAYVHTVVYLLDGFLMILPAAWESSRIRGWTIIVLMAYPVAMAWLVHSSISDECTDYYKDECKQIYHYFQISKDVDLYLFIIVFMIEFIAVMWPADPDEEAAGQPRIDLSVVDFLYGKENVEWKRPLLIDTKVSEYSGDLEKWREVVGLRNKSLEEAMKITDKQLKNSSEQARLLGKYSQITDETTEKVTRAGEQLDKQAGKIVELNAAVDEVIAALGSSADMSDLSSAFSMTSGDCRAWFIVIFMCFLVAIGLLIGIPKWLKLFNISLGINI